MAPGLSGNEIGIEKVRYRQPVRPADRRGALRELSESRSTDWRVSLFGAFSAGGVTVLQALIFNALYSVDTLADVMALGKPAPIAPPDLIPYFKPRILNGTCHAVVGSRRGKC
jgi:hypothetical protein